MARKKSDRSAALPHINVAIPQYVYDAIKKKAANEERTMSNCTRVMLVEYLRNNQYLLDNIDNNDAL